MNQETTENDVFNAPVERKKRIKVKKERLHIYITTETKNRIREKYTELGLDQSNCIQMLLNYALNNLKTTPPPVRATSAKQPVKFKKVVGTTKLSGKSPVKKSTKKK